jgi:hypothetical protein
MLVKLMSCQARGEAGTSHALGDTEKDSRVFSEDGSIGKESGVG